MAIESWEVRSPAGVTGAVLADTTRGEVFGPVLDDVGTAEALLRYIQSVRGVPLSFLTRTEIRVTSNQFHDLDLFTCRGCDNKHWDKSENNLCPDCEGRLVCY